MTFDWLYALEILPELIDATLITIRIALLGYLVSLGVGLLLALARLSRNRWLSTSVWAISEGIRLTPLLVQLFFAYYVLPAFGLRLPAEPTGVLVIGIHYSTYISEVYRAGIRSVPTGHGKHPLRSDYQPRQHGCVLFFLKPFGQWCRRLEIT